MAHRDDAAGAGGAMTGMILHVCQSDRIGGAAVAARRLIMAQRAHGIDAHMLVGRKQGTDDWVHPIEGTGLQASVRIRRFVMKRALRLLSAQANGAMQTLGAGPRGMKRAIADLDPSLVHFHWLGGEMTDLAEMRLTRWPVVWTCHDQWVFCGAEHYAADEGYRTGYAERRAFDPDRFNLNRKRRTWKGWKPHLIGPSSWMTRTARESVIARDWDTTTIPNTLDTDLFSPMEREQARAEFGLPADKRVILFGAQGGDRDPRKGFDLLAGALSSFTRREREGAVLIAFGGDAAEGGELSGIPFRCVGTVTREDTLARLYNAADIFAAPSRQDNLPNTMLEAQSCGTPCAAFDVGGMSDIIAQPWHGTVVPAFDTAAFARALLQQGGREARDRTRQDALSRYSNARIAGLHAWLYEQVIEEHHRD